MSEPFLFCPLRKEWVAALPEEKIRQEIIQDMTQRLGYPMGSLLIEKGLSQLPHLQGQSLRFLPKRRIDLLVFAQNIHPSHPFYPLLLIECKSIPLTQNVLRQVVGYNQFVRAYFIAVTNQTQTYLGAYHSEHKDFRFQEGLLPYSFLLESIPRQG